ncbi:major facilitator superfamily domain-containing protein [Crepidotus variabilis]|uniref:Major facilitator superfamily domain-containing protein n=1 Tax=Crepidotus variabilis TaxID=179855 RepID=A0A9P6EC70_9AGAR|nr:major facilitator superfamily domain-containing protein [Crepidotus variabilis]
MSEVRENEKYANSEEAASQQPVFFERPTGIKGFYLHPVTQVVMLGLVCFMCPGLFNALNGLGAGGQVDSTTSANSNSALYATFAVSAFFAGSINNRLGARLTLFLGSTGYALYIGSYLAMNIHPHAGAFVIAAGAILGICAGLLWTAQGSLMLSYPTEIQKGRFISIFWTIFNLGAVIGSSVSLAINFGNTGNSVSNSTYIAFLVLTLIGASIPLLMANPHSIVRTDGSKLAAPRHPSWKVEIYGLWVAVRDDPLIIMLFPMFLASNWFYTWQFNGYNAAIFNIQARSLNNFVYWVAQIIGSIFIGFILDTKKIGRRARAFTGWGILFFAVFALHIWAYFYQKDYSRQSMPEDATKIGIHDKGYVAKIWLYFLFGVLDAVWQITVYWIMGAMSNDPAKLAHFTGLYKSIQSAGAAGMWRADAVKTPYMTIFLSTWILMVVGLLFALPMIHLRVKDTTDLADETLARMDDTGHIHSTEEAEFHQPRKD